MNGSRVQLFASGKPRTHHSIPQEDGIMARRSRFSQEVRERAKPSAREQGRAVAFCPVVGRVEDRVGTAARAVHVVSVAAEGPLELAAVPNVEGEGAAHETAIAAFTRGLERHAADSRFKHALCPRNPDYDNSTGILGRRRAG